MAACHGRTFNYLGEDLSRLEISTSLGFQDFIKKSAAWRSRPSSRLESVDSSCAKIKT